MTNFLDLWTKKEKKTVFLKRILIIFIRLLHKIKINRIFITSFKMNNLR